MTNVTLTIMNDDGDEREVTVPGRYEVCGTCDGHGTHLTPSIRDHAYSREEFEEAFFEEEEREAYFKRGGMYDVQCETCKGRRVVLVPDLDKLSAEDRKDYDAQQESIAESYRIEAAERRMGA